MSKDRNFDDLIGKFKRNIYATLKGQIRLAVLKRDLQFLHDAEPFLYSMQEAAWGRWRIGLQRQIITYC